MQPPRACDRCHSIRARCIFAEGQTACERCHRLKHTCQTNRKVLKVGRPRKQPQSHEEGAMGDLKPREARLVQFFLENQRILVNNFVNESNFSDTTEYQLIRLLDSAPGRIKDALLALAGALISEQESEGSVLTSENAIASIDRICKAIERLRRTHCSSVKDAKATLFVALSLISFHDISIGYGILPIARAALLSVQPFYHELMKAGSTEFDTHLIPVIFAEVSECIRCREIPTIRYSNSQTQIIDRSYGIAQEVLPHLYDICLLSHELKTGELDPAALESRALQIHLNVNQWNPVLRTDIEENDKLNLSAAQRSKIIWHAECYKLLVEVLLHQLEGNRQFSAEKAEQLRQYITALPPEPNAPIQFLLFPYFVACTEIQDEAEQEFILGNMKYLSGGIATQSCNSMFAFLQFLWATPGVSWFDLSEDQRAPQMSIGP